LRTRISAAKEEINMNYQIQGLSIHAEVHGTAEPALIFLNYWGGTSRTWIALANNSPFGLAAVIFTADEVCGRRLLRFR